jgi:hypothetical protein
MKRRLGNQWRCELLLETATTTACGSGSGGQRQGSGGGLDSDGWWRQAPPMRTMT